MHIVHGVPQKVSYFYYCPRKRRRSIVFSIFVEFFSVNKIANKQLELAQWNFARTGILTICRNLLNIKVKPQGYMGFCVLLLEPVDLKIP